MVPDAPPLPSLSSLSPPCRRCSSTPVPTSAQEHFGKDKSSTFQLFGSPHGKDLLFTDAACGLLRVPPKMDIGLYLGYELLSAIRNLKRGMSVSGETRQASATRCGRGLGLRFCRRLEFHLTLVASQAHESYSTHCQ